MTTEYPKIVYKKHSFFSTLIMGLVLLIVTVVISVTVLLICGMNFVGERSESFITVAENAVRGLPAFQESLPPVLSDMLNDHREPEYRDNLVVTVEPSISTYNRNGVGTAVKVVNNGPDVVTLLSIRVVVLDLNGRILNESNEWVVTPFAIEDDWPGPLLPGSERYISTSHRNVFHEPSVDNLKVQAEITDIRIWNGQKNALPIDVSEPSEIEAEYPDQAIEVSVNSE